MISALIFDSILMNVPIPILVVELESGIIIHCNNNFRSLFIDFNINPIGKSVIELHLWKRSDDREKMIDELKKNGCLCNYSAVVNDRHGNERACTLNVNFVDEEHKYIVTTIIDVSCQIWQEEKYGKLYNKYRMLLDGTKTGYVILDDKLIIQECNDVATEMIGEGSMVLVGEKFVNILRSENDTTNKDLIFKLHKMTYSNEQQLLQNIEMSFGDNRQYRWARANIGAFGDNKIVILLNDITEVKVKESRKFIVAEKEKDKIRQGLLALRQEIHAMTSDRSNSPQPTMILRHHIEPVVHHD